MQRRLVPWLPFVTQSVILQIPLERYARPKDNPFCTIRWFRDSDVATMTQHGYPRFYIRGRLKKGARLVVAEAAGRTVGWKFCQTGEVEQLAWFTLRLPADMFLGVGAFVVPGMRGKRIWAAMTDFAISHYQSQGYRRLGSSCETWNTVAISNVKRLGGSEVVTLTRRNYLLFHTADVNGRTRVGWWSRFNRLPVDIP
jgi:hypothetical protein